MSKQCDLCSKSSQKGSTRSHSNIKTNRRQNINLQSKTVEGLKIKVCPTCRRTLKKREEAIAAPAAKK